jgi:hypothetical protein
MLLSRPQRLRDPFSTIVISSEGSKTEKQYFLPFAKSVTIVIVEEDLENRSDPEAVRSLSSPGAVRDRLLGFLEANSELPRDSAWLVMDMDRQHIPHFPEICTAAEKTGYSVALSNPCFELWLWLHHFDVDMNLNRCKLLKKSLGDRISGFDFSKWNPVENEKHRQQIDAAMERARNLSGSDSHPIPEFPGTHVPRLMERILSGASG